MSLDLLFNHLILKVVDEYGATSKQKKRRAKRNAARRKLMRQGKVKKGDGKDVHHKDGNLDNEGKDNLSIVSDHYNRNNKNIKTKRPKK